MPCVSKVPGSRRPGLHAAQAIATVRFPIQPNLLYEALIAYEYMKQSADQRNCPPSSSLNLISDASKTRSHMSCVAPLHARVCEHADAQTLATQKE